MRQVFSLLSTNLVPQISAFPQASDVVTDYVMMQITACRTYIQMLMLKAAACGHAKLHMQSAKSDSLLHVMARV